MVAMPGYEIAFTDSDVRLHEEYETAVINYLGEYQGSFEPLLEAKGWLEAGNELTVPVIRKVLNCIRHDVRASDYIPEPRRAEVIPIQRQRNKKNRGEIACPDADPHSSHSTSYDDDSWSRCPGVPWPINRYGWYWMDAKVKAGFAAAKGGKFVHRLTGKASTLWTPPHHEWGFGRMPDLSVKLVCRYPSYLRNPHLFKEEPVHLYGITYPHQIGRCKHCFAEE